MEFFVKAGARVAADNQHRWCLSGSEKRARGMFHVINLNVSDGAPRISGMDTRAVAWAAGTAPSQQPFMVRRV